LGRLYNRPDPLDVARSGRVISIIHDRLSARLRYAHVLPCGHLGFAHISTLRHQFGVRKATTLGVDLLALGSD
jgi:hypothetical protein